MRCNSRQAARSASFGASFGALLAASFALSLSPSLAAQQLNATQPATIPAGYRVETIPLPDGVAFGVGGLSFAPDGTLYICTREGQVWTLADDKWQLFADGLHEPLGIYVDPKSSKVFVVQRPELTELIDQDGDGRAERFRTVSAAWGLTNNYHEYAYGPVCDSKGNFYGTLNTTLSWPGWAGSDQWDVARVHDGKMGRAAKYRGWSFRVTPDGTFEPWSSGLRSPAGIAINAADELFCTDNQGDWVATSCLHVLRQGDFHGHPSSLTDHPKYAGLDLNTISVETYGELREPAAVNFPHGDLANSPGEPVVDDTNGKFGPFAGQMFVGDQTRSNVFRVVLDKVQGRYQGCAINFIDHLQSGIVRSRFANDGSLWVGQTGRGWRSRGKTTFGLERIVWDGVTVPFAIHSVRLTKTGFEVRFTRPADATSAASKDAYRIDRWRYQHHPDYGSPKFDQTVQPVSKVELSADRMTAHLFTSLRAGTMHQFTIDVAAADGSELSSNVAWYTLNRLRK
ncbi:MAG: glucose/arabinose dehydrogenase [Planctomycetota bacterium]|jgi:glucose/arabinose dehydrogenase